MSEAISIIELSDDQVVDYATGILESRLKDRVCEEAHEPFTSPALVRQFLHLKLGALEHEMFAVLFLDNKHRLISYQEMFRGTIDAASVHPREVVKEALRHNAAAVIVAHNHPSGVTEPSRSDLMITERLKEALSLVEVRALDHIVVGHQAADAVSFAERGLL
ncbi:DNA repair protein RadC [Ectothiorhodospira haloalkaliphila]|uniref:DNA repair protein RadC n=1 Tax=Ectothiorhodospira haloalkaliphila TaxID=421628 RepID=W8KH20_9GAMM|nr:DNA repair protein RadC [Ectothiorhodospira haloalkaliphila]AHK79079.1 DNA repair protein RadC [Ectothiorhodospira haloalkaliphila]MCG5526547.1 DNA repair protein RadC [Ectothiorhodospira haloalkaliphila]